MYSLKKSLITLVGLFVLAGALGTAIPLVGRGQNQGQAPFSPKKFYLTQTFHKGNQALSACATGYHMASLWEIFDTSHLRYDTQLGFTKADSGSGPPAGGFDAVGWIRTGREAGDTINPGFGNCNAWTSDGGTDLTDAGTVAVLGSTGDSWNSANVTLVTPWQGSGSVCSAPIRVWCVQD